MSVSVRHLSMSVCLSALIVAQIYPSVHLCVCARQLESVELSIAANLAARRLSAFFPKLVQGTHVWYIFGLFRLFLIN